MKRNGPVTVSISFRYIIKLIVMSFENLLCISSVIVNLPYRFQAKRGNSRSIFWILLVYWFSSSPKNLIIAIVDFALRLLCLITVVPHLFPSKNNHWKNAACFHTPYNIFFPFSLILHSLRYMLIKKKSLSCLPSKYLWNITIAH